MRLLAHAHGQCSACFDQRKTILIFWLQNRGFLPSGHSITTPPAAKNTKGRGLSTLTPFYLVFTCWTGKKSTTDRRRSQQAHGEFREFGKPHSVKSRRESLQYDG